MKNPSRLMPLLRHAVPHLGIEQTPTGKTLGLTNARVPALRAGEMTEALLVGLRAFIRVLHTASPDRSLPAPHAHNNDLASEGMP